MQTGITPETQKDVSQSPEKTRLVDGAQIVGSLANQLASMAEDMRVEATKNPAKEPVTVDDGKTVEDFKQRLKGLVTIAEMNLDRL